MQNIPEEPPRIKRQQTELGSPAAIKALDDTEAAASAKADIYRPVIKDILAGLAQGDQKINELGAEPNRSYSLSLDGVGNARLRTGDGLSPETMFLNYNDYEANQHRLMYVGIRGRAVETVVDHREKALGNDVIAVKRYETFQVENSAPEVKETLEIIAPLGEVPTFEGESITIDVYLKPGPDFVEPNTVIYEQDGSDPHGPWKKTYAYRDQDHVLVKPQSWQMERDEKHYDVVHAATDAADNIRIQSFIPKIGDLGTRPDFTKLIGETIPPRVPQAVK